MDTHPAPWETPFGGPAAWKGSTLDWEHDGLYRLSDADVQEIDAALSALKVGGERDLPEITRESFPLPRLGRFLAGIDRDLRFGRGFVLIRGLDRSRYAPDDLAKIYYGIGAHLGRVIPQSGNGELLGHVLNVSDLVDEPVRGYRSNQSMNMHSDGHDVVGLLCLQAARSGGASQLASAVAIHDRVVAERPDLARVLYAGMKVSRMQRDAERGNGLLVTRAPVALFDRAGGEFFACIHPSQIRDAARGSDGGMTREQEEALDLVCRLAASPEFYLDMEIAPGDIQFVNNRLVLHGRTTFDDFPELSRRRHLLRLWLLMDWPQRPASQPDIFALDDLPGWSRHRTPFMELPSRYLAEMAALQAGKAA